MTLNRTDRRTYHVDFESERVARAKRQRQIDAGEEPDYPPSALWPVSELTPANVTSSLLTPVNDSFPLALHSPCIDLDFEARLIESSTPGHHHLYLDGLIIDWPTYRDLLLALAAAGVIEHGYASASIARRQTILRLPGIEKPDQLDIIDAF